MAENDERAPRQRRASAGETEVTEGLVPEGDAIEQTQPWGEGAVPEEPKTEGLVPEGDAVEQSQP